MGEVYLGRFYGLRENISTILLTSFSYGYRMIADKELVSDAIQSFLLSCLQIEINFLTQRELKLTSYLDFVINYWIV